MKTLFRSLMLAGALAPSIQANIIHYSFQALDATGDLAIDTSAPLIALSGSFDPDGPGATFGNTPLANAQVGMTPDGPYVTLDVPNLALGLSLFYPTIPGPQGFITNGKNISTGTWFETQPSSSGVPDNGSSAMLLGGAIVGCLGLWKRQVTVAP